MIDSVSGQPQVNLNF